MRRRILVHAVIPPRAQPLCPRAVLLPGLAASIGVGAANRDGDWPMPARDFANTRYVPMADINTANVGTLRLAFTFSTGVSRGHEAAPIVVGDTMYIVTPYPNIVYALELSRPGLP